MLAKIRRKFIGNKDFQKEVLTVAIPLMLQMLITTSVALVDSLMVGQLGDVTIGAVAAVNRFFMIANFGTNGIITAATIFLAQYYGAKNQEKMRETFRFTLLIAITVMLPFTLIGLTFSSSVVAFFNNNAELISVGSTYLQIVALSFIPAAISLALSGSMRAIGEVKLPLFISIITVFTNATLNYLFIFGFGPIPALGAAGAAIATLIARLLEVTIFIIITVKSDFPYKTKIMDIFNISKRVYMGILEKGFPLFINEVLWASGMATILKIYATRGVAVMSAYSIATTTSDIFFSLFSGMAIATTVVVSQKLGANKLEEARANGYKMIGTAVMMASVFGVLMFLLAFIAPQLFNVPAETKLIARNILLVMSMFFWIYMCTAQMYFVLRAGGDTKSTLLMDATYMWFVNIPLLALLAYTTDASIYVIYICGQCTDILKMILASRLFRKERWVKNLTSE